MDNGYSYLKNQDSPRALWNASLLGTYVCIESFKNPQHYASEVGCLERGYFDLRGQHQHVLPPGLTGV